MFTYIRNETKHLQRAARTQPASHWAFDTAMPPQSPTRNTSWIAVTSRRFAAAALLLWRQTMRPFNVESKSGGRTWLCAITSVLLLFAGTAQSAETSAADFAKTWQQWQATGIHDYEFALEQHCFCPNEEAIRIVVKQDDVASASYVPSGQVVSAARLKSLPSLNGIFRKIEDAYARNAASIQLSINPDYGYPERVFIDYTTMIADEELIYVIRDFSR